MEEVDEHIDIALNTNYDPSFFDWADPPPKNESTPTTTTTITTGGSASDDATVARYTAMLLQQSGGGGGAASCGMDPTTTTTTTTTAVQQQSPLTSLVDPVISNNAAVATAASLVQQPAAATTTTTPPALFYASPSAAGAAAPAAAAQQQQQPPSDLPPFLLFDAPIELRANFMSAQRAHGLPPLHDSNSAHYAPAAPGANNNNNNAASSRGRAPRLVDGRHGDVHKKDRNVREQKRTQKIADLIDQLRVKMEKGGWAVGVKSKFHTLSSYVDCMMYRSLHPPPPHSHTPPFSFSCAEYVKHLVQVNKEKEKALEKIKRDLEEKRRKMEEDDKQNQQQVPSDRESTTSSLTASSEENNSKEQQQQQSSKKRSPSSSNDDEQPPSQESGEDGPPRKKQYQQQQQHQESSHASSNNSSSGAARTVNMNHVTASSVSTDLTDSNKEGSSSEGNSSNQPQQQVVQQDSKKCSVKKEGDDAAAAAATPNPGSIVSDAAVAPGVGSHVEVKTPTDVVWNTTSTSSGGGGGGVHHSGRPSSSSDGGTTDTTFEMDYKEVFLKSNIPQIISTTSGRIIAWNDFFLRATGLQAEEASRLTIFSLVRSNKLANLFDIVAASLRAEENEKRGVDTDSAGSSSRSGGDTTASPQQQRSSSSSNSFTAITLPCTNFRHDSAAVHPTAAAAFDKPLYMTVTLMKDEDPRKRCFHCVFTDCPGTNGTLGMVTPELLSKLFARQGPPPEVTDTTTSSS